MQRKSKKRIKMQINSNNVINLNGISDEQFSHRQISFYVDTNIWYWLTYPNSNSEEFAPDYATLLYRLNNLTNIKLLYSHLTFAELTAIIEGDLYHNYQTRTGLRLHKKSYRKIPRERNAVVDNISSSIHQIAQIAEPSDDAFVEILNYIKPEDFISTLRRTNLDGTDILMANFIKQNDVKNVITNDRDYLTINGLNIYTYDERTIEMAETQGINTNFDAIWQ